MGGAAVGQVVAIDGGDNGVAEAQGADGLGHFERLVGVEGEGAAGAGVAEFTGAGTDVACDEEGGGATVPAFAEVGASAAFADGVEAVSFDGGAGGGEIGVVASVDSQPVRFAEVFHLVVFLEEVDDAGVEVQACDGACQAVVFVGVDLHFKVFSGFDEGGGVGEGVLEMDVVVGGTVDEEEVALQPVGEAEGRAEVVIGEILVGRAHKTFGIDGIVETPVGYGGDGDAGPEDAVAAAQAHQGIESAITPAPDGDSVGVDVGESGEMAGGGDLVVRFGEAELEVGVFAEFFAA